MNFGQVDKVKFTLFGKKVHMFSCGDNGLVLEQEQGAVCLYATDAGHNNILCAVPLGPAKALRGAEYYIFAHSQQYMLMGVGRALFVVDFVNHFCATNQEKLQVFGSDSWGQEVKGQWQSKYLTLFGIPDPNGDYDETAAGEFWRWFAREEGRIASMAAAGGSQGAAIVGELDRHLTPVFPYERGDNIQFQLGCNDGKKEFFFYHHNDPRLHRDGQRLRDAMPRELSAWTFHLEA